MKAFLLIITLATIILVQSKDSTSPNLRGLDTVLTIKKITLEQKCSNIGEVVAFSILLETDVNVELNSSGIIQVDTISIKENSHFNCKYENDNNKKVFKWDGGEPEPNEEYHINKFNGINPKFDAPNFIKVYLQLITLFSPQNYDETFKYDESTNSYSFKIKFNQDVLNFKLPVLAKKGSKTINLDSYCKSSTEKKEEVTCTIPQNILTEGEWKVELSNECFKSINLTTLKITAEGKASISSDDSFSSIQPLYILLIIFGFIIL